VKSQFLVYTNYVEQLPDKIIETIPKARNQNSEHTTSRTEKHNKNEISKEKKHHLTSFLSFGAVRTQVHSANPEHEQQKPPQDKGM
jgi:hypothetical protein